MKARLTIAMTVQVAEDQWERQYNDIDVEVIMPNYNLFGYADINKVFLESDIVGGRWLKER